MTRTTRNIVAATLQPENKKYSVIIPAAGMGNRMKSYGPKSLLLIPDTGMTILDNQLKHIYKYLPQAEIIIVAGFEAAKIRKYVNLKYKNVKVVVNEEYEATNVVRSIGIGLACAKYDDVVVIYGDLIFNAYTLKVPFGSNSLVVVDGHGRMGDKEVGCIVNGNLLERMMYTLPTKWAQIAYFKSKELDLLHRICQNRKFDVYFGFEIINIILNSGGQIAAYSPIRMKVTDVDSSKELEQSGQIAI